MIDVLVVSDGGLDRVKAASLVRAGRRQDLRCASVCAYDAEDAVSVESLEALGLPESDASLALRGESPSREAASLMVSFEEEVARFDPAIVAVLGDDPLTLRCALVAVEGRRPVARVEGGRRGSDRFGRGSLNSRLCDHLATVVFTVCRQTQQNLLREGFSSERVVFVGSMVADVLQRVGASEPPIELPSEPYAVVVLGRSALDEYEDLRATVEAVVLLSRCAHVVIPLEQRARARLRQCGLEQALCEELGATVTDRLPYAPFVEVMRRARVVLTDVPAVQEETTALGVSCLTLADSTTRGATVAGGTNQIVGTDTERIVEAALTVLEGPPVAQPLPELWDGGASARIVAGLRGALRTPALTEGCR